MQVPVPCGNDDEPRHSDRVSNGTLASAPVVNRSAGIEEAHLSPLPGGTVCARPARV